MLRLPCAPSARRLARVPSRRRLSLHAYSILTSPQHALPVDVDPTTGLCAEGRVRIAEAPGKGLGAFAAASLPRDFEVGTYRGEILLVDAVHARYSSDPPGDPVWHASWYEWQTQHRQERERRGVGCTGRYVFKFGLHPTSGRLLFIDAEDPCHANFTRFFNHSSRAHNLSFSKSTGQPGGEPLIRFATTRDVQAGEELTFDCECHRAHARLRPLLHPNLVRSRARLPGVRPGAHMHAMCARVRRRACLL